jgi:peptidoglycan/LPS O-acetylase OafA/YrhL
MITILDGSAHPSGGRFVLNSWVCAVKALAADPRATLATRVESVAARGAEDTGPQGHISALDGVRGAAILLVMIYHFATSLAVLHIAVPMHRALQFGWCGVDVFFTLSGFLITGILVDSRGSPHFFRNFYGRRALRIFPLYFGAVVVVAALTLALPNAGVWGDHSTLTSPGSLLWPALFLENVALALHDPATSGILTHFWTLAVEEHFYLLWPLLIWASRSPRQILTCAAIAAVASLAGRAIVLTEGADLGSLIGLTPLRIDGLAIGALAAVLVRTVGDGRLARPAMVAMGTSAMLLVALLVVRRSVWQSDPAIWLAAYPLTSLFAAATILTALGGGVMARLLSAPFLRWFGRYSYGLYVWHPIINVLLLHSRLSPISGGADPAAVLAFCGVALCLDLIVAWASYHCWEKGFLRLKRYLEPNGERASRGGVSLPHPPSTEQPL